MSYETVIMEKKERIATITMNRPEKLNAITVQMEKDLYDAFIEVTEDDDVRVVVFTGAGRGFCSGEDVAQRPGETPDRRKPSHRIIMPVTHGNRMVLALRNIPKPVIAAVNGPAVGQGLSFCLHSDIRIASENARFGAVWMLRGIPPESFSAYILPQIVGIPKAIEMVFTGRIIDADEAKEIGLVSNVYPIDKFVEETYKLAGQIAKGAPIALALAKKAIYQFPNAFLDAAMQLERFSLDYPGKTEDREEGLRSFLEKREANFQGK
jgi:2-(1,2-epoxy-1,2-dihydrophenyl)acetyl-CoA isomerase